MSFDKLLVIGVVAALLLGPSKLPGYAEKLGRAVSSLRRFAEETQRRVSEEVGESVEVDWKKLDPRQYDPRKIIRDALFVESADEIDERVRSSSDSS